MSPLAAFFRDHPERKRIELARAVGVTPSFVTQLCGTGKPGRVVANRIAEWTNGIVRPEHWDEERPPIAAPTTADAA
ncbi:hypothetical protein A3862_27315 [Methylobacterium sp. XJLW]|jgi:hypothetical protein|uniref:hypothetical protein n=1 Tax=Methylobacterium sp. XJLW TaxID=739141 RepID=UPI000DAB0730|nr:hypothetical protein [Methylobacterium sp. XJLW]AWV18791.1 hypothetical protein A3862_27315 [Methylobacterium sp. XJLW]